MKHDLDHTHLNVEQRTQEEYLSWLEAFGIYFPILQCVFLLCGFSDDLTRFRTDTR